MNRKPCETKTLKLCHFDVVGVTETLLNSEIINGEIDIEDYNLIRRGRQGGGCVIYCIIASR